MPHVTYYHSKWKAIGLVLSGGIILFLFACFALFTENGINFGFGWVLVGVAIIVVLMGLVHLFDSRAQLVLDEDGFEYGGARWNWAQVTHMRLQIRSRGLNPFQQQRSDDQSVLNIHFSEGSLTIDISSLNVHGEKIFEEIQRFWNENRHREDLQQRTRSMRQPNLQKPLPVPTAPENLATYSFGATLVKDGIEYYPDWSAAMLREFNELSADELAHCFETARKLHQYDASKWDELLVQWGIKTEG